MERVVVNSVVSRGFFFAAGPARSRLHFFPSAGTTAGHYPVACELTLFGKGLERRSISLDGGRLNQPDGIRLEDAFPAVVSDLSGLCGLEVRLSCPQGRINLLNSRVVIETVSPQFSLAFSLAPFQAEFGDGDGSEQAPSENTTPPQPLIGIAVQDAMGSPSLIVVNAGRDLERPDLFCVSRNEEAPLHVGTVSAESVAEFPLDEALCKQGVKHEAIWGDAVIEKFWSTSSNAGAQVSWYVLYRDPVTKRPVSVCAL